MFKFYVSFSIQLGLIAVSQSGLPISSQQHVRILRWVPISHHAPVFVLTHIGPSQNDILKNCLVLIMVLDHGTLMGGRAALHGIELKEKRPF